MGTIIFTIFGLALFEIINSVDNAVINAEVLSKMSPWAKRWFLLWGILFSVFAVRGLLPWLILWLSSGNLTAWQALVATFSSDISVHTAIEVSAPLLLIGAGVFLILLFLHWLFLEQKNFGLRGEAFFYRHGIWFFFTSSTFLAVIIWFAVGVHPILAFAAAVGSSVFFLVHGFKQNAELVEARMLEGKERMSDWSKIMFLEVIDACFSIDGVLGAFAFTLSIPIILIGNGIGAVVVRKLTVSNMDRIKKVRFLKNGAMYSILFLGIIMLVDAFGVDVPQWASPAITFAVFALFLLKSFRTKSISDAQAN